MLWRSLKSFYLQREVNYPSSLGMIGLPYCFQYSFENISKKHHESHQHVKQIINDWLAKAKNFIKSIMTPEAIDRNSCTLFQSLRNLSKPI